MASGGVHLPVISERVDVEWTEREEIGGAAPTESVMCVSHIHNCIQGLVLSRYVMAYH